MNIIRTCWRVGFAFVGATIPAATACSSDGSGPAKPKTTLSTGIPGYYNFEGDATDASGAGRDGTRLGGASVSQGYLALGSNYPDALSPPASTCADPRS